MIYQHYPQNHHKNSKIIKPDDDRIKDTTKSLKPETMKMVDSNPMTPFH